MNAVETMLAVVIMGLVIAAVVFIVDKANSKKDDDGSGNKGNGDTPRK